MTLKERWWKIEDRYDAFIASKFQTHLACAFAGMIVGAYLAFLVWK